MKKRSPLTAIRPNGILRWSTACILLGGTAGLTSCEREETYTATDADVKMAGIQKKIETLDSSEQLLKQGLVENNFSISGVGYYHAAKNDFFEHPYNFERDGKWYVNGAWQNHPEVEGIPASRPSPEALKKVDAALTREQQTTGAAPAQAHSGGGFGVGNMLMMYWLLSGNRGMFSPGAGFQNAGRNVGNWQSQVNDERRNVSRHASANPGYNRMVEQSKMRGTPVSPGQSVRGGFGSSSSGSSFGS